MKADESESESVGSNFKSIPRPLFKRAWSYRDEIVLLEGMIEFSVKNKADPMTQMNAFLEFIKNILPDNRDVSRTKLRDKIKRLKKKYLNNKRKGNNGNRGLFYNNHDSNVYNLSNELWGNENAAADDHYSDPESALFLEETEIYRKTLDIKIRQTRLVLDHLNSDLQSHKSY